MIRCEGQVKQSRKATKKNKKSCWQRQKHMILYQSCVWEIQQRMQSQFAAVLLTVRCRTTEFCMKAISWKQAFRNHFHTKTALLVPWQINSNATLKILNEKVRKDKALKKIQRTRNSRKQAKANLTVSHLVFGSDGRIGSTRCWSGLRTKTFNWEFDPGSGWTLAACLTHASRTEMRCEREVLAQNNLFVS